MEREILEQTNDCYDAARWDELDALAKGGKRFHKLITKFLPQNPQEPEGRYEFRKRTAKYHSYVGSIINLYSSWLFISGFDAKAYAKDSPDPLPTVDPWYGQFQDNVGSGTNLKSFMKERFREAMTKGKAVWLAELPKTPDDAPNDLDRATYDKLGLGNATLTSVDPACLLDWECDDEGHFVWAIIKECWNERASWNVKRNIIVERWRIFTETDVHTFEFRRDKNTQPSSNDQIRDLGAVSHGFKRVPLLVLQLPEEMCVGEQTYDAQLAHFQHDAALSFALKMTCYPMLVVKTMDEQKPPRVGTGYALMIGTEEDISWVAPSAESFQTMAKDRDQKRDEIFRVVHQMAQGLDNNAETVGRSADSKEIDAAATRIMLNAYGESVGKAIEETFELISEARGDSDYKWSVEGFSGYDTATVGALLAAIEKAKELGVPSNTFLREISKKAALALVPELGPSVKHVIRSEIDKFNFEVDGKLLEERLLETQTDSDEEISTTTIKSQEKQQGKALKAQAANAKLAAKAKANQPKPASKAE